MQTGVWEPPFQPVELLLNFPDLNIVFTLCPQQKKSAMGRTTIVFLKVFFFPRPIIEQSIGKGKNIFSFTHLRFSAGAL